MLRYRPTSKARPLHRCHFEFGSICRHHPHQHQHHHHQQQQERPKFVLLHGQSIRLMSPVIEETYSCSFFRSYSSLVFSSDNKYFHRHRRQHHLQPTPTIIPLQSVSLSSSSSSSSSQMEGPVTERLNQMVQNGEIEKDVHQIIAAKELDRLYHDLMKDNSMVNDLPPTLQNNKSSSSSSSSSQGNYQKQDYQQQQQQQSSTPSLSSSSSQQSSLFGSLFQGYSSASTTPTTSLASHAMDVVSSSLTKKTIPGAYMYGGVGCGKTFLMELLYDAVDTGPWSQDKQKIHYHKFMLNIHQHMHQVRKELNENATTASSSSSSDLMPPVVQEVLKSGRFLCLDEFQVTDIADAMILQRLFEGLWDHGCVVVATSNRPPQDLYLHGIQRDRFLPFIDLLQRRCNVITLMDSETDYRMISTIPSSDVSSGGTTKSNTETTDNISSSSSDGPTAGSSTSSTVMNRHPVYFSKGQSKEFHKLFRKLTDGYPCNPTQLETIQGRKVQVPMACTKKRIAQFSFEDLCQKALGAADYLVIGQQYSTVFCHSIPKLTIHHLNWLRRFITFVDTMYELKVTLILHTHASSIDDIFVIDDDDGDDAVDGTSKSKKEDYSQDEVFAFDRTRSRLEEMSSKKYLSKQWLGNEQKEHVIKRLHVQPSLADE